MLLALFVHLTYSLGQFTGTLSRKVEEIKEPYFALVPDFLVPFLYVDPKKDRE